MWRLLDELILMRKRQKKNYFTAHYFFSFINQFMQSKCLNQNDKYNRSHICFIALNKNSDRERLNKRGSKNLQHQYNFYVNFERMGKIQVTSKNPSAFKFAKFYYLDILLLYKKYVSLFSKLHQVFSSQQNSAYSPLQIDPKIVFRQSDMRHSDFIQQIEIKGETRKKILKSYIFFHISFCLSTFISLSFSFLDALPPSIIIGSYIIIFRFSKKINQMAEGQHNDMSFPKQFNDSEVSMESDQQVKSSSQNSSVQPQDGMEDEKQFPLHEKVNTIGKFPFHHYLRQHYKRLSLQQQIHIFQSYFIGSKKNHTQLILQTSHIEILNEGLNLFTKLPEDPLIFLLIQKYSQTQQILTLKNQNGQIVHFQIVDHNKKRCTIIGQIKRKLKGRAFIIINDQSNLPHLLNQKTLNKLTSHSNLLYLRHIQTKKELENLKKQFFKDQGTQVFLKKIQLKNKNQMIINLDGEKFYAYFHQTRKVIQQQAFSKLKHQFFQQFQALISQQNRLISTDTKAMEYKVRLRIFDYLYINFLKSTGKNKQQFFVIVQKMVRKAVKSDKNAEQEGDHYPKKIFSSRRCKCCEILERGKNKKSKYKCIGCSIKYQTDIPLCIGCFEDFHEEILPNCGKASVKNLKRAYEFHLNKGSRQNQMRQKSNERIQKKIENNEQIRQAIINMNENMNQIEKLMGELQEHSFLGAKIVKQFNQALFVNIIQNFNYILEHKLDNEQANLNDQSKTNIEGLTPTNPSNKSQNS